MKSYTGNPNSLADSILTLLFDPKLCETVTKNAISKVKKDYNWQKIAQDTHFTYQKAIAETMAERHAKQAAQEQAQKQLKKSKEFSNLLPFRKGHEILAQ